MTGFDPKADLLGYLQGARETLLWKLDGLGEYDIRRPLTPTGTNLLGLVKHQTGGEFIYFGDIFGRTRPGTSSPACTGGRGSTRTPRSRNSRWTPPRRCRGGAVPP
jgi:hypothetical protein